jgi:hypothetical protein
MSVRADLETAMDEGHKVSKAKAGYSGGMKKAHCALCKHFESPDACEYVSGTINPQAWCKFFEPERKS